MRWVLTGLLLAACGVSEPPATEERYAALAGAPAIQVGAVRTGGFALFRQEAMRDGRQSYLGPGGVGLVLDRGLIIASRGTPDALMAVEVEGLHAALRQTTGGETLRRHWYLTGTNENEELALTCAVRPMGPREVRIGGGTVPAHLMVERCDGVNVIENLYWLGRDGDILQSRQWIGPRTGALSTRLTRRPAR
ncbi:YjbF family lipoprotein [Histidinibacterium aquaticum]|uniref:YjbF family lipoprotein n=1 Tax=Histidinibacterium aquaticum TaxID=2613962 RepID=A0A5J5GFE5_9RHOB|nr:YjbF family lipoprotein [Histidinibacterium aquaticum]KAA9006740.1 YjbF family lipoprotein [Histidinibacterium aquaticum]